MVQILKQLYETTEMTSFCHGLSSQKFFRLTSLRKLSISENDLNRIPPGIANLTRLAELDISKNGEGGKEGVKV